MSYKKFQIYFFIIILTLSGLLTLFVFRSYLTLLAFGGVVAVISRPVYLRLLKLMKSETAAAFLTILAVALIALMPLAFFLASLSVELISMFSNIKGYFDLNGAGQAFERFLPAVFHDQIPALMDESLGLLRRFAEALSQNLLRFFSDLFSVIFGFIVVLISAYYLLKDGTKIKQELLALSPLGDEHDELVFKRVILAVGAVMNGIIVVGAIKGVVAGLFFWIFGVPAPLFWGAMTGLASFLPLLGSSLITVPASLFLLLSGDIGAGVGLLIVSVALIGTVDNFLQPKLVESKTKIHPLLILLSILGGLNFYGFAGFILGPLTLAVTIALVDIYKKEFRNYLEKVSP